MKFVGISIWLLFSLFISQGCRHEKQAPVDELDVEKVNSTDEASREVNEVSASDESTSGPLLRAEKLGFSRHLPEEIECLITLYRPIDSMERLARGKLWSFFVDEVEPAEIRGLLGYEKAEQPTNKATSHDIDDIPFESVWVRHRNLFQNEVTIAIGPGSARPLGHLGILWQRLQILLSGEIVPWLFQALDQREDHSSGNPGEFFGKLTLEKLLLDEEFRTSLSGIMDLPPVYSAFLTNPETRQEDTREITNFLDILGFMGEMVSSTETQFAGTTFSGKVIHGNKVAEMLQGMRPMIVELLGDVATNLIIDDISKIEIMIMTGVIDDYFILLLGSSEDQFKIVSQIERSIGASGVLAFADPLINEDLVALIHGAEILVDALYAGAGTPIIENHMKRTDGNPSLLQTGGFSAVAYSDEGIRIESFTKAGSVGIDWSAVNQLGGLDFSEGVFIFANFSFLQEEEAIIIDSFEGFLESIHALTLRLFSDYSDTSAFQMLMKSHDWLSEFRDDMIGIWNSIYSGLNGSIGPESAWVLDLNGGFPAASIISKVLLDHANFPRLTFVAPVSDSEGMVHAWKEIHHNTIRILSSLHEQGEELFSDIQPVHSKAHNLSTLHYPVPYLRDGFKPSLTFNESWVAGSTCEMLAIDLIRKAGSDPFDQFGTRGLHIRIDFKELQLFLDGYVALLQEHAESLDISDFHIETLRRFSMALMELDLLRLNIREEDDIMKSSMHLKVR